LDIVEVSSICASYILAMPIFYARGQILSLVIVGLARVLFSRSTALSTFRLRTTSIVQLKCRWLEKGVVVRLATLPCSNQCKICTSEVKYRGDHIAEVESVEGWICILPNAVRGIRLTPVFEVGGYVIKSLIVQDGASLGWWCSNQAMRITS
jgi:hypothetical protein